MTDLRDRVVAWKERYFHSAWARYDLARPGSFQLLPAPSRIRDIMRDYEAMREMYLAERCGMASSPRLSGHLDL
ncbi:MAG: hypothetical protein O2819_07550 [Planctomycetota bacterium]|nr:hypothetical protein [Planctomycetota bacterium]MDA1105283.1 hypothetical protein [Planctomycetota bacterium]